MYLLIVVIRLQDSAGDMSVQGGRVVLVICLEVCTLRSFRIIKADDEVLHRIGTTNVVHVALNIGLDPIVTFNTATDRINDVVDFLELLV